MCDFTNGDDHQMDIKKAKGLQKRSYRGHASEQFWDSKVEGKVTKIFEDGYLGFFCDPDRWEEDGGLCVFRDSRSKDLYAVKSNEPVSDDDLGVFTSQNSGDISSFRIYCNAITGEYYARPA